MASQLVTNRRERGRDIRDPAAHRGARQIFLTVREDPEPLYFWASDLAYCGHTTPAIQLLRESIRRNFCASAIETDPTFAAIRKSAEYGELLLAARACQNRFREHVRARGDTP